MDLMTAINKRREAEAGKPVTASTPTSKPTSLAESINARRQEQSQQNLYTQALQQNTQPQGIYTQALQNQQPVQTQQSGSALLNAINARRQQTLAPVQSSGPSAHALSGLHDNRNNPGIQASERYADIVGKADERRSSLYGSQYAGILRQADYAANSQASDVGGRDITYQYINNLNNTRNNVDMGFVPGGKKYRKYNYLTADEIGVYNYIYATQGKREANRFLDSLDAELNRQDYSGRRAQMQEEIDASPLFGDIASLGTVLAQPYRTAMSIGANVQDYWRGITDQEIDPYSELRQTSLMTRDIRQRRAENIAKTPGILGSAITTDTNAALREAADNYTRIFGDAGPNPFEGLEVDQASTGAAAAWVYQTAMSAGDSAMNMMTTNALFGGMRLPNTDAVMKATNYMGAALMSSEVASLGVAEAKEKGYDDLTAIMLGMIRGGVEFASEAIGGDWVIQNVKENPLNFLKTMALNMVPEGVEEVMSDVMNGIINVGLDTLLGTHEMNFPNLIREFSQPGWEKDHPAIAKIMDKIGSDDPNVAAVLSVLGDEVLSFLSGAVATVGSSGVQTYNLRQGINTTAEQLHTTDKDVVKLMGEYQTDNPYEITQLAKAVDAENAEQLRQRAGYGQTAREIINEKGQEKLTNALIERYVQKNVNALTTDQETRDALMKGFADSGIHFTSYAYGIHEAARMAQEGFSLEDTIAAVSQRGLNQEQIKTAWEIGEQRAQETAAQAQTEAERFRQLRQQAQESGVDLSSVTGTFAVAAEDGVVPGSDVQYSAVDESRLTDTQKDILSAVQTISQMLGLNVTVVSGKGNFGGAYTGGGRIFLNIDSGMNLKGFSKAIAANSFAHEMTHWLDEYAHEEYEALTDIIRKSMPAGQLDQLVREQMRTQRGLSPEKALEEVIANACQPLLENSQAFEQLARQNMTLAQKILDFMKEFVSRIKSAFSEIDYSDNLPIYEAVQAVEDHLQEMQKAFDKAILAARENMAAETAVNENTAGEGGTQLQAFKGYDPVTGRGIYESNFPENTPSAEKSKRVVEYIQKVWSKQPIDLVIQNEDGTTEVIQARFDPDFDETGARKTDAGKLAYGNRRGNRKERRVTLNLADDYYQILQDARYIASGENYDPVNHPDVEIWHYFVNDILYMEQGKQEQSPYSIYIDVKKTTAGEFVYTFHAEENVDGQTTPQTITAAVNSSDERAADGLPSSIVTDTAGEINPQNQGGRTNLQLIGQPDTRVSTGTEQQLQEIGSTATDGVVVADDLAETMRTEGFSKPVDPLDAIEAQLQVWTTDDWEKSFLKEDKKRGLPPGDPEVAKQIRTFTDAMIANDAIMGYVPNGNYEKSKFGPLRRNIEYRWTFDMDASCPRTFQFVNYRNALQEIAGRPLTDSEALNLMYLMRRLNQQIPCTYCYVENKRVMKSKSYLDWFQSRSDVMNAATDAEALTKMYSYNAQKGTVGKAAQKVFDEWRADVKAGRALAPTAQECWTAWNTAKNSVFNWMDHQLAEGAIRYGKDVSRPTPNKRMVDAVCRQFGVTDKAARREVEGFVAQWRYDVLAGSKHVYGIANDTDVSEVNQDMLRLHRLASNYASSVSQARLVDSYIPYTDQLKNVSQADKDYINAMGGIRKHSSNDFRMDYVQDYFLFYADLARGGWNGHTYTKSVDYCKVFGRTGDRINLSIAMNTENSKIVENKQEGAAWQDARELREAYPDVGVMAMVTDNAQLSFALNTDWIDMCIPFHASGLPKSVWYNVRAWSDYTSVQLESWFTTEEMRQRLRDADVNVENLNSEEIAELFNSTFDIPVVLNKNGGRVKPHFFPSDTTIEGPNGEKQVIPGHHNDAKRYMELCEQYGVHPRFYGVSVTDTDGNVIDVTEHPNYVKLIKETSRTDTEQTPIEFNFNEYDDYLGMTSMEYAMQRMQEEAKIGGYANTAEDPLGIVPMFRDMYLGKNRDVGWMPSSKDHSDNAEKLRAVLAATANAHNEMYDADVQTLDLEGYQKVLAQQTGPKLQTWSDGPVYNDRALVSEETLDKWMSSGWYGSSNPNYAQAFITSMSPSQFLKLTTLYDEGRVRAETTDNSVDRVMASSESQPIQLMIDTETGKIYGHEGRHRMVALERNGVYEVPVLLFDSSNKYSKEAMKEYVLHGQDFHGQHNYQQATVFDVYPLNQAHRQQIVNTYSKQSYNEGFKERNGYAQQVRLQTWDQENDELVEELTEHKPIDIMPDEDETDVSGPVDNWADALFGPTDQERETKAEETAARKGNEALAEYVKDLPEDPVDLYTREEPVRSKVGLERMQARKQGEKKTLREKISEAWHQFIRSIVNEGDAIHQAALRTGNRALDGMYFYAKAATQRAQQWITERRMSADMSKSGKSLNAILDPIRAQGDDYYRDFQLYLYHMLNIDRWNRSNVAEIEKAQGIVDDLAAQAPELATMSREKLRNLARLYKEGGALGYEDGGVADLAEQYLEALANRDRAERKNVKPVFGWETGSDVSQKVVQDLLAEHPEFEELAQGVYDYVNDLLQYRVDAGLITQEDMVRLQETYPHYIPVFYDVEGADAEKIHDGNINVSTTIKKAKGGDHAIQPFHYALSRQTLSVMRNAGLEQLGLEILKESENNPQAMDRYVKDVEEAPHMWDEDMADNDDMAETYENAVSVLRDGKRYTMTLDGDMSYAFQSLKGNLGSGDIKILRMANDLFKKLCTAYNPLFMITNPVRDIQDALFYSTDTKRWLMNYPKAISQIANNGEFWQMYKGMGAVSNSYFDWATAENGQKMGKVEALNMAIEQAPRLAEFMTVLENAQRTHGSITQADRMEAFNAAAEVTTNFGRSGTLGKWINRNIVPFWNPGVQGLSKAVRTVSETKSFKAWANLAIKAAALGILPALLNGMLYKDDDEWDVIDDQMKMEYYLFKGPDGVWIKIPKGRVLAALSMPAVGAQEALRGDEVDWGDLIKQAFGSIAPNNPFQSNLFSAAMQADLFNPESTGKTWYGGNIESRRLQSYAPGERYDESTDAISKWLGGKLNLSPKKLSYILDQYSGVIGDLILPYLTPKAERGLYIGDFAVPLSNAFMSRFTTDTVTSNTISSDYYDLLDELGYGAKRGDEASAMAERYLNRAGGQVSDIYAQIREIENDKNLTNQEKSELVRELRKQLNTYEQDITAAATEYLTAAQAFLAENPELDYNNDQAVDAYMAAYNALQTSEKYEIDADQAANKMKNEAYREINREVFGAEYALEAYDKDVYAKAQSLHESSGLSYDDYYDYYFGTQQLYADKDENGKSISGSKKEKVVAFIAGMDIPDEQKDALFIAAGYSQNSLGTTPWHNGSGNYTGSSGGRGGGGRGRRRSSTSTKPKSVGTKQKVTAPKGIDVAELFGGSTTNRQRSSGQADLSAQLARIINDYYGGDIIAAAMDGGRRARATETVDFKL